MCYNILEMDIQKITHKTYRMSVFITLVLSGLIVAFAALVGRGIVNLRGSLVADDLRPIGVIMAVEKTDAAKDKTVDEVRLLPRRPDELTNERRAYVWLSNGNWYAVKLLQKNNHWTVDGMDRLHGDPPSAVPAQ